jgi:hypothetical protein
MRISTLLRFPSSFSLQIFCSVEHSRGSHAVLHPTAVPSSSLTTDALECTFALVALLRPHAESSVQL